MTGRERDQPAGRCCNSKCCRSSRGQSSALLRETGLPEPSRAWSPRLPSPSKPSSPPPKAPPPAPDLDRNPNPRRLPSLSLSQQLPLRRRRQMSKDWSAILRVSRYILLICCYWPSRKETRETYPVQQYIYIYIWKMDRGCINLSNEGFTFLLRTHRWITNHTNVKAIRTCHSLAAQISK